MRVLAALALLLLSAGAARAATVDCEAMEEVLQWTAEALLDIRDGKPANGDYIVDAVAFAADKTAEAGWPGNTFGVLDELSMLAVLIEDRRGKAEPGDGEGMLGYADALAETMAERCGSEDIPVFVRPGVGDGRACAEVIETLDALAKAMPSVRGEGAAMRLLPVVTIGRDAIGNVKYSQWSAASVAALSDIQKGAELMSRGDTPTGANAAQRMQELAAVVVAEAQAICVGEDIPRLAAAGG